MTHLVIRLFEQHAWLLQHQGSRWNLDDSISELAAWIDLARYKLTDDDMAILGRIGGVLYREGLQRRQDGREFGASRNRPGQSRQP